MFLQELPLLGVLLLAASVLAHLSVAQVTQNALHNWKLKHKAVQVKPLVGLQAHCKLSVAVVRREASDAMPV